MQTGSYAPYSAPLQFEQAFRPAIRYSEEQGVLRAMNTADTIRFTLKGMRKASFQRWLERGLNRSEPVLGQRGWTNRELYEILTVEHLRAKTTFYGELGEQIDEPGKWLDCS
ncbi:MAG TPA: hypothetical protein VFW87_21765 [Pirellulales bacterium]|nr:hypothetical protein [Pirellulales bacterium]